MRGFEEHHLARNDFTCSGIQLNQWSSTTLCQVGGRLQVAVDVYDLSKHARIGASGLNLIDTPASSWNTSIAQLEPRKIQGFEFVEHWRFRDVHGNDLAGLPVWRFVGM